MRPFPLGLVEGTGVGGGEVGVGIEGKQCSVSPWRIAEVDKGAVAGVENR